jgi:hypothetical protein
MAPMRRVGDPRFTGFIFRESSPQLRKYIVPLTEQYYPMHGGKLNRTELVWTFPSGAKIWLAFMESDKDVEKYKGTPAQYIGIDEVTYFSFYQYTMIKNWCRPVADYYCDKEQKYKPEMGGQRLEVKCSGMPMGPHVNWVKEYFVDHGDMVIYTDPETGKTRQYIKAVLEDNPTLQNRAPDYGDGLKALGTELYNALRHADWTQIVGAAFKELNQRDHMVDYHKPPLGVRILRGGDWGYEKPFAFYWAYIDFDGKLVVFKEWYAYGGQANKGLRMSSREVAKEIKRIDDSLCGPDDRIVGYLDPACWGVADDVNTVAENMAAEGVVWYPAKHDRIQGKMEFHTRLSKADGGPHIKFADTLRHFWRTVPSIQVHDRKAEDVDTNAEDHSYDALRYLLMSLPMLPGSVAKEEPKFYDKRYSEGMEW